MDFLDKIFSKVGFVRAVNIKAFVESITDNPFILWNNSKKVSADKAMAAYKGWVFGATRAIAEELGFMEFILYKIKKDGDYERVYNHELLDLLENPNPLHIGFNLRYKTAAHLELTGNSYWLMDVENENDKPTKIYPLNPKYLKIKAEGEWPDLTLKYEYRRGKKTYYPKPHQIIHFQYPDPDDDIEGVGVVQTIADWIDEENFATQFNRNFFKKGAKLSGLLKSESANLTEEQVKILKKSFEQAYSGVENAYSVAVIPKNLDYQELGTSQKDMDFVEGQKSNRDKILSGFRVPKTILGVAESETNRATAETADYVFAARTIKPKMKLLCSYLNMLLVPRFGDDLYLDFVDPVPENRELRIKEMQAAAASQPVISVNEAREEYFGLEGIENGDSVMTDFSKIPLGKPTKKAAKPRIKLAPKRKNEIKELSKNLASEAAAKIIEEIKRIENKKNIAELSDDEFEPIWKAMIGRVTPFEKAQKEVMKKFNIKWEKEVLENLETAIKSKAINEDNLFDYDNSVSILVNLSKPIQTDLFAKEAKEALKLIGIDAFEVMTPEVRKALNKSLELMAESYNDTTLQLLKSKLEQGLNEGAGLNEMKDLVRQVREFSDEVRAEQVARTETFRVANDATHEAWRQSEIVKTIKWFTAADERVCPFCEPMHGKVIGIEDRFFSKDDEITGSDGSRMSVDYEDINDPPLHVSCRCYVRPETISID